MLGIKSIKEITRLVSHSFFMNIPSHRLRHLYLTFKLKSIGSNTYFMRGCEIRNGKNISIGDNCVINKKVLLDGRGGQLVLGNNVDIAQEVNIWTLEHDVQSNNHQSVGNDVIIEDFVWVASRATILPGVKLGKGCVVASCGLVTKNIEPFTIVGGVPTKPIGKRNKNLKYILNHKPRFQ